MSILAQLFVRILVRKGDSVKIGLIDVDGHNFPNLPQMKISAWHKACDES